MHFDIFVNMDFNFFEDLIPNEELNLQEIKEYVEEQYVNLENLTINYIKNIPVYDSLLTDLITYFNDNYCSIVNANYILDNGHQIQIIGRFIYEFIVEDLITVLLPRLTKLLKLNSIDDIATVETEKLKETLITIIKEKIQNITHINNITNTPLLRREELKFTYYVDLIDNDFSELWENLIIPIINKYAIEIDSNS